LDQEIVDIQDLDGVGPVTAGKLREAGFDSVLESRGRRHKSSPGEPSSILWRPHHTPLMNPLAQPDKCRHPELEIMAKFRGDETIYRCLVCEAVVSSRELDRGD
jgi:hypothetical protein